MNARDDNWLRRAEQALFAPPDDSAPKWKSRGLRVGRLLVVVVRDVVQGNITLWTMSLVYTTLLSMVPLLALSFSVLKAFGVHNQIEPLLGNLLAPLGEQGSEVSLRLIGFIEKMNVGVLGALGLALLVYTVISLMQKIEEAFNSIWHVTQLRSLGERFSRYISALLIGPLFVFSALAITATAAGSDVAQRLIAVEPFGVLAAVAGRLLPYVLVIGAFTFLYRFVPNTRVRVVPALVAGGVGGVLWQSAGWAFAEFVVSSTRYAAIYSSFAILVLFLIWLYTSWLVLLVGASVSFYVQHPEYLYAKPGEPRLSNRMRERLALAIVERVAAHFVAGRPPWTLHALAQRLNVPMHSANVVLDALVAGGVVHATGDDPPAYVPARDLAEVRVADVLARVRVAGEDRFLNPGALPLPPHVEAIAGTIDDAIASGGGAVTLRELVTGIGVPAHADAAPPATSATRSGAPRERSATPR